MPEFSLKGQKGLSLYLAVIIMSIIMAMVLGITTIITGQIKTMKGIESSVIAFYGADTGIERLLKEGGDYVYGEMLIGTRGKVVYTASKEDGGAIDWCPEAKRYCIRSFGIYKHGTYKQVKRAIKITM